MTTSQYQCNDDVELENLPDEDFSSNDGDGSNIKYNKTECWSPAIDDAYVQVNLGEDIAISGYRISGIETGYVETFTLSTKKKGQSQFEIYKDDATDSTQVFNGNSLTELDVNELFPDGKTIVVDSIRVYPKDVSSDTICMKFDLVGCTKVSTSQPTTQPTG